MTGGSPRTTGVYYDVAYDRSLDAPTIMTGNGVAAGPCTVGANADWHHELNMRKASTSTRRKLNGGAPGAGLGDGGVNSIDPKRLPRDPKNGCAPVMPWNFVRTNTIFGVIHAAGGYTAWSDKHPAYSSVASGPGGIATLTTYYSPEINSNVVALPGVTTPTGLSCATVPDPTRRLDCMDQQLPEHPVLRYPEGQRRPELDRWQDPQRQRPPVPDHLRHELPGGQRRPEADREAMASAPADTSTATGTPTHALLSEIQFVDASIGEMGDELKAKGLSRSDTYHHHCQARSVADRPKAVLPDPGQQ